MTASTDKPIIIALDYPSEALALEFVSRVNPNDVRLKVGKELFTSCGPALVEKLVSDGFDVFLDLKFHDIPSTAAKAVKVAADLGVWMVNVHASGGRPMLEACCNALVGVERPPLLIAVTILTSLTDQQLLEIGMESSVDSQVLRLAKLTQEAGLQGVVCSAREASAIRSACGSAFMTVTPGIRPQWSVANDQKRIVTPKDAIKSGSHYLVIGRPITAAEDPQQAIDKILTEIELASS